MSAYIHERADPLRHGRTRWGTVCVQQHADHRSHPLHEEATGVAADDAAHLPDVGKADLSRLFAEDQPPDVRLQLGDCIRQRVDGRGKDIDLEGIN